MSFRASYLNRFFVLTLLLALTMVRPTLAQNPPPPLPVLSLVTIETPRPDATVRDLRVVSGSNQSAIIRVDVAIRRQSDGFYWNGALWQMQPILLRADLNARGWSYLHGPDTRALTHGVIYRVVAIGYDSSGRSYNSFSLVRADVEGPRVSIAVPNGASLLSLRTLTGFVNASLSRIARVEVSLQRRRDGAFWDGRGWVVIPDGARARRVATLSGGPTPDLTSWLIYNGPPRAQFGPGTYAIRAYAYDELGNVGTKGIVVFSAVGRTPILSGRILYTEQTPASPNYQANIFSINADGSGRRQLTRDAGQNYHPQWSADQSKIAFLSDRNGEHLELFVIDADGTNPQQLTHNAASLNSLPFLFNWSPDNRYLVYEQLVGANNFEIYRVQADGGEPINLTQNSSYDRTPVWTPDGKHIAFLSDRARNSEERPSGQISLWTMNADGSQPRDSGKTFSPNGNFRFSPDGRQIAFSVGDRYGSAIFISDPYNVRPRVVTALRGAVFGAWSPDGKRIVFESSAMGREELWTINADGSDLRQLTDDGILFSRQFDWR